MDDIEIISYFHPMGLVNPSSTLSEWYGDFGDPFFLSSFMGCVFFHLKTTNHRSHIPPTQKMKKTPEIGWAIPRNVPGVSAKYMETQTNTLREPEYTPRASPRHPQMKGRVCWKNLGNTPKTTTAYNSIIIIILIGFPFRGRDHEELTNKMVNLWEAKWCGKKSL